jgi:hypothetical protein
VRPPTPIPLGFFILKNMINTFTAGNHILRKALQLSLKEMAILSDITRLSWNSRTDGWCIKSRRSMADYLDLPLRSVQEAMQALYRKGYIEYPDDLGVSDSRVRCTEFIYQIRELEEVTFVMTDEKGGMFLASSDFFTKIKEVNPEYDDERLNKYLKQSDPMQVSHTPHANLAPPHASFAYPHANFAYNKVHIKEDNKDISLHFLQNAEESIAKSDTETPPQQGTNNGLYETAQQRHSDSYARIGFSSPPKRVKKERSEAEMKIKAFKPLFIELHGLYQGRKSDAEDHFKKLFNKLKTSKQIDLDLQEFEIGLKNYMEECRKRNTEQMYIKHFKNFIHDMVWREYKHSAGETPKPTNQLPTITAENAHLFKNLWD